MLNKGNPPSVTKKAIKPPIGKDGLNAFSKADCNIRSIARPAKVLRKAAGAAISKDVKVGAAIPKIIAKIPRKTAAIQ